MFIQVIQGTVADADGLRRQFDAWETECRPGAVGFLGSTAGITDDGRFIAIARFESADAAARNGERPEQSAWWEQTAKCLSGDVTFRNTEDTFTYLDGGSDDATFVQVMQGRVTDAARLRQLTLESEPVLREQRPDLIGGVTALFADGTYTDAVYFRSEAEARANEQKEPPAEFQAQVDEWMSLQQDVQYLDLHDPWMH